MPKETQKEREQAQGIDELDDFLADCGEGTITVRVTRLDPPMGYCGEFFVTESSPLTLRELKRRFGGRVFQLNTRSSNGQIRKQKTISIDDVPRREGFEILPDGSTMRPGETPQPKEEKEPDLLSALVQAHVPPDVMRRILPYALGYGMMPEPQQPKQEKQQNAYELIQQQQIMEMMNNQLRQQMEFQREMQKLRRENDENQSPKNPYSEMEMIFKMMREIQGFKSELGGEHNLASEALASTMELAQNGLAEYLALKKLQAQGEIARNATMQQSARELPQRSPAPQLDQPRVIKQENDPVKTARDMGAMFRSLDGATQQKVLNAFLGDEPATNPVNIENIDDSDTIENEGEFLNAEDREILNGDADPNENEADHISDSEHTAPAHDHDPVNRAGDTGGINTPTH